MLLWEQKEEEKGMRAGSKKGKMDGERGAGPRGLRTFRSLCDASCTHGQVQVPRSESHQQLQLVLN